LSLTILPEKIKKEIQDKIAVHIVWMKENGAQPHSIDQFSSLVEYLNESHPDAEAHIRTFVNRTMQLDKRRNESFPETFPEYADWWKEITKNTILAVNL
jgi:predicted phosphoadenosine phosphosulfate sulfurtransferase